MRGQTMGPSTHEAMGSPSCLLRHTKPITSLLTWYLIPDEPVVLPSLADFSVYKSGVFGADLPWRSSCRSDCLQWFRSRTCSVPSREKEKLGPGSPGSHQSGLPGQGQGGQRWQMWTRPVPRYISSIPIPRRFPSNSLLRQLPFPGLSGG